MELRESRHWAAPKKRRIVIAAGVVIAGALMAWSAREGADEQLAPVTVVPAVLHVVASVPEPPLPQQAAAMPAPVVAGQDSDQVQLCGGEWVNVGVDGDVAEQDLEAIKRRALNDTLAPTLAHLLGSSDERARAAGHFLQAADAELIEPGCNENGTCSESKRQSHRASLVQLARSTADPQVYAWAYQSCAGAAQEELSGCEQINIEQWARLDPGNATPWMHAAGLAKQRGDARALDEALFHVASAERQDLGWERLAATIIDHIPNDEQHLLGAESLLMHAVAADAAVAMPYGPAMSYCSVQALADANRRETCSRVADVLVEHSTTLIDRAIGTSLGERLGWPTERIKSLRDERDAIGEVYRTAPWSQGRVRSCKAIVAGFDWIRDVASQGELAAARNAIAASGKSVAQLAAQGRTAKAVVATLPSASASASGPQLAAAEPLLQR